MHLFAKIIIAFTIFMCCYICLGQQTTSLDAKIKRFTQTTVTGDVSRLSAGDQTALKKLIESAKLMDSIYLRQVWSGNIDLWNRLQKDTTPEGKERAHYFRINMGPWSNLDHDEPFIDAVPK